MFLRIENISPRILVGKRTRISVANNTSADLWRSFMPHKKFIQHVANDHLYSVQIHEEKMDLNNFDPHRTFEKWAAVEVIKTENLPEGMEPYQLQGGLYAVFLHKGTPMEFFNTIKYILAEWMPASEYETDLRPQFEVMDHRYKNNDPDSEEEVWIPVKKIR